MSACAQRVAAFDAVLSDTCGTAPDTYACFPLDQCGKPAELVSGTLTKVTRTYEEVHQRYSYRLDFKGTAKTGSIFITTAQDAIPYKIGTLYTYDPSNVCALQFSAASSGNFFDPELNALQEISC
mgnify:CR=1 FL=1